jgi:glycosyltransferase involved in cell wall biosynthesis
VSGAKAAGGAGEAGGPRVSVLIPAWRAADVLGRAVASLSAQSLPDWEAVIVDDASQDGTHAAARRLAEAEPRLRVLRHAENRGAAAARNTALGAARGRYVAFLDADDEWHPDKLARQIDHMERLGVALGYTGFVRARPDGQRREVRVPPRVTRDALLRGNVIGCLTAVYDRARLGDRPMPDLPMRHDYALWLSILADIPCAHGIPAPLATHHVRAGSLSSGRLGALRGTWAMHRGHLGHSPIRAAWYMGHHLAARLRRG